MPVIEFFGGSKKAFLAAMLQISIILMLSAVAFMQFLDETVFFAIQIALTAMFLKILFLDLKKETKKEHKYSSLFFFPLLVLAQLSWILQKILEPQKESLT